MKNPFTPNFGQVPTNIAGRTDIIDELEYALENSPGDPALTTILIGARGTGKTALLTYISKEAEKIGWISVNVSCLKGLLEDIYLQTIRKAFHLTDSSDNRQLKALSASASLGPVGVGIEYGFENKSSDLNFRLKMTDILDSLDITGTGLLITIDEVNTSLDEMIEFASVYQMLIREERKIALTMAGLPHNVSLMLKNRSISFLKKANQRYLHNLQDYEIRESFKKTMGDGGKKISEEALEQAVKAIGGFPYMFQLVGYRAFMAGKESELIGINEIESGIRMAEGDLKMRILKSTLDEISDKGIEFLTAMLPDEESSALSDLAERLGKSSSYISTYKTRLCEHGVIIPTQRGKVSFAIPFLREYLQEYL